ncbi:ATP-binding cassette domain-containing protein [Buchnera aphidicola (Taiwanaphis decaspermi)]|uniref:ATP-binding cassette domain-containing protein n=1 Tax=Buchnera aphidicola TaxID=9 RepID=UPI0031B82A5C
MKKLMILKKICFNYNKKKILKNISLSIKYNNIITLIGPNGAGKTTLIRIIIGLLQPNSGKIIKFEKIRVGYVPQKLQLNYNFPINVYRFMQLYKKYKKYKIFSALKAVGANNLSFLDLKNLSGGEMQKVLLARSLLNNPNLLVLDEPTKGLDFKSQFNLCKLINKLRHNFNCAILIVSHDLNLVMSETDKLIFLNKNICCSGKPEIVYKNIAFTSIFGLEISNKISIYHHNHKYFKKK